MLKTHLKFKHNLPALANAKKSKTFRFFRNLRFMINCTSINFSPHSRQFAATAQNFRNKNF